MAAEEAVFRKHGLQTIKGDESELFLKDYALVYKTLWNTKTEKMG